MNYATGGNPPTFEVAPTVDIATLEAAAEALARHGEIGHAVAVWAIVLRLRYELQTERTNYDHDV